MATSIGIEIVRKFADQTGLVVHPQRWLWSGSSLGSTGNDRDFATPLANTSNALQALTVSKVVHVMVDEKSTEFRL